MSVLARGLLAAAFCCASAVVTAPAAAAAADVSSAAGEIVVVTVNAHQRDLDEARLTELVGALAGRPAAADGRVYAPDVIVVEEIVQSVLIRLRDQLNTSMNAQYQMVGLSTNTGTGGNVKTKILLNTETMSVSGHVTWTDVCDSVRIYQMVTARELASGQEVAVAGVHFAPNDNPAGTNDCRTRNAQQLRSVLAPYDAGGSVVGDFNRRAVQAERECDVEETSAPMEWYSTLTADVAGHAYVDSVRAYHRRAGLSMANQWTFEDAAPSVLCDGSTAHRRYRLDYVFHSDSLTTVEATADTGWGATTPGDPGCEPAPACKYSDHRFVWSRLALPVPAKAHVGDLDAARTTSKSSWRPTATVEVHDAAEAAVGGATVTGRWSTGQSATCTTGAGGRCTVNGPQLKSSVSSARFTVTALARGGYTYDAAASHDPDGDSTGTSVTVYR